jgi:hypothetical protein
MRNVTTRDIVAIGGVCAGTTNLDAFARSLDPV